jgi:hypothetical protein
MEPKLRAHTAELNWQEQKNYQNGVGKDTEDT